MMRLVDLRGQRLSKSGYTNLIPRAALDVAEAMKLIEPILLRVKNGNESDLIALAEEFDGIAPQSIKVPRAELTKALNELDPAIRKALEVSAERIRKVHNDQRRNQVVTHVVDGGTVSEKWVPVDRVGLYVPGGRAVYPSSVMMNVIPAQIANVSSIAIASPPQSEFGGCHTQQFLQRASCSVSQRSMQLVEHKQLLSLHMAWKTSAKNAILLRDLEIFMLLPQSVLCAELLALTLKLALQKLQSLQMKAQLQPMLQQISLAKLNMMLSPLQY